MKKKVLFISALVACVAVVAATGAVFAWVINQTSVQNTVTVKNAVTITVSGDALEGTNVGPDWSTSTAIAVVLNGETGYNLVVNNVEFTKTTENDLIENIGFWSVGVGPAVTAATTPLTAGGATLQSSATQTTYTVWIHLSASATSVIGGGTLTFDIALVK